MNPTTQTVPKARQLSMSGFLPPKVQPNPSTPPARSSQPEIVSGIPVKSPIRHAADGSSQPINNPIAESGKQFVEQAGSEDKELDHILRDVTSSVRKTENSPEVRFGHLSGVRKTAAIKKDKLVQAHNGSPPIVATVVALAIALGLSFSAVILMR